MSDATGRRYEQDEPEQDNAFTVRGRYFADAADATRWRQVEAEQCADALARQARTVVCAPSGVSWDARVEALDRMAVRALQDAARRMPLAPLTDHLVAAHRAIRASVRAAAGCPDALARQIDAALVRVAVVPEAPADVRRIA